MLSAQERAPLIEQIRRLPDQIDYLAGVLTPDEMNGRFVAGEWSAAQNIHHLVDSHMNSYVRCRLMVTEEEPFLKPYDQDRWAVLPDASEGNVSDSLSILRGLHGRWARFYEQLPEEAWERTGSHPERGVVTLESQLQMYAKHGLAHVDQIRRTVAAQYAERPVSKAELLGRIDREWARLGSLFERMTPDQMEAPLDGGWSPKDHLAHISAWERNLIRRVNGGQAHTALGLSEEEVETSDIDTLNALLLQASASKTLGEVKADALKVHAEARAAVAAVEWKDLSNRVGEWHGEQGPLLDFIGSDSYWHYLEHWQWMPIA